MHLAFHTANEYIIYKLNWDILNAAIRNLRSWAEASKRREDTTQGQRFLYISNSRYPNLTVLECSNG